jgi:putative nucleotidyltransferase with HDIG domain
MEAHGSRILIVDDDPVVGELIRQQLSEKGFSCQVTQDPRCAGDIIDTQPPDVMITDIEMPGTSGLELLVHARKRAPQCKVVLATGYSKRQYLVQALLLGAHDYIEKPFRPGELVEVVSRVVNGGDEGQLLVDRAVEAMEFSLQVRQASLDSVGALVRAVEAKDPYTRRHSEQVAYYAVHLARAMGMSAADVESIRVASLLHDIGKIGVPDHILIKAGPLTDEEFQQVSRHPALGSDILANITLFASEAKLIRHHHERWDGKGYPDGLVGEETPLASRIILVADCIDAMLMERTYKAGYSVDAMMGELIRCAGTQFDPKIAAAALAWCQSHREALFLPGKNLVPESISA